MLLLKFRHLDVTDTLRHNDVCTTVEVLISWDHTEVLLAILLIFYLISASFADLIDGAVENTTLS